MSKLGLTEMPAETEVKNRQEAALSRAHSLASAESNLYREFTPYHVKGAKPHAISQKAPQIGLAGKQTLENRVVEFRQPTLRSRIGTSWLFDSLVELESLRKTALSDGIEPPTPPTLKTAEHIIRTCDAEGLSAPLLDLRDNGGVEIFCRENDRGLLIVVNPDGLLQVFDDFSGEPWRSRYDLSGIVWQAHLVSFFRELRPLQAQKRA